MLNIDAIYSYLQLFEYIPHSFTNKLVVVVVASARVCVCMCVYFINKIDFIVYIVE